MSFQARLILEDFGGAVSGGARGGLGGFVGEARNAWLLQGANFNQGLQAGFIGGGVGLAGGALWEDLPEELWITEMAKSGPKNG